MRKRFIALLAFVLRVDIKTIDFIIDTGKSMRFLFVLLIPSIIIGVVVYQVSPIAIKFVLDILVSQDALKDIPFLAQSSVLESIIFVVLFSLILSIVDACLGYADTLFTKKIRLLAETRMEEMYFQTLSRFDMTFLSADNNIRLLRNVGFIITSMQDRIIGFIRNAVSLPTAIISLIIILPVLHPYFFIVIFCIALLNLRINGMKAQQYRNWEFVLSRVQTLRNTFRWNLFYSFGRFHFNGLFPYIHEKYSTVRNDVLTQEYTRDVQDGTFVFIQNTINAIASSVVLLLGAFMVIAGTITVGSLALVNSYVGRFNTLFDQIGWLFGDLINLNLDLTRIEFVLQLQPKLKPLYPLVHAPDSFSITFRNVSFTYPSFYEEEKAFFQNIAERLSLDGANTNKKGWYARLMDMFVSDKKRNNITKELTKMMDIFNQSGDTVEVLHDINVKLTKGTMYALVGKNGAGKSTLVNLLKRGFDATSGVIEIDGVDIRSIDNWRESIVSIEQHVLQFDGMLTIGEQLLLHVEESHRELKTKQAWELIRAFELDSIITSLDMHMGENIMLSGGQRQIVELIRILLSNKPLVILDEATNQLDAEKELLFISLLKQYLPHSIVIFVTHRMSTCNKVDTIISLKHGVIEAMGSPEDMARGDNQYSTFYAIQQA